MANFDKNIPPPGRKARFVDDDIRQNNDGLEDALVRSGMKFPTGYGTDAGEFLVPIFQKQTGDPASPAADKLKLYVKTVGAQPRLYIKDPGGNVKPLAIPGEDTFPSGTKMLFYQDTAPAGWTIQNTLDDKLAFVTKGSAAGGQTGGGVHSSGSWTISGASQAGHTHTGPSHTHTGPSHTHALQASGEPVYSSILEVGVCINAGLLWDIRPEETGTTNYIASSTVTAGGNGATGAGGTGETSIATPTITFDGTWRPAAYCCIICEKQ